jgi:hypothetical protein
MCTIFTKNPTKPMTIMPMPVESAIFLNSEEDAQKRNELVRVLKPIRPALTPTNKQYSVVT